MPAGVSAWEPLANLTLSTTPTTISFSSINQGYKDLYLIADIINNDSRGGTIWFQINNDSGSTYNTYWAKSAGGFTAGGNSSGTRIYTDDLNITSSTSRTSVILNLMDYSATTKRKAILSRAGNGAIGTSMASSRWPSTAAITSISMSTEWGFAAGSTFALYGVTA